MGNAFSLEATAIPSANPKATLNQKSRSEKKPERSEPMRTTIELFFFFASSVTIPAAWLSQTIISTAK